MSEMIEFIRHILLGECTVVEKQVKAQQCSGIIYVPKKYLGRKVILVIPNED